MNQHRRLYFSVFIILCFLLALLSLQNSTVHWLDAQMFRLASHLLPVQSAGDEFRVVQLDEARLQKPEGIREFRFFLRKLRKAKAAEIVWLSDDFPQMDYVPIGDEIEAGKAKPGSKSKKTKAKTSAAHGVLSEADDELQWRPTQGERNKLAWMLEHQQVFLTQYTNVPDQQNTIPYTESLIFQQGWRQYIPAIFLPEAQRFRLTNTQLPYRVYPFNPDVSDKQSLIWYDESRQFSLPDLSLAVFSRYQKIQQLVWREAGEIQLDKQIIPLDLTGRVFGYFSALTARHTDINTMSLKIAASKSYDYYKDKIILIGQDSGRLQILADSLSSLQKNAIYYTPSESWWLLPLILVAVVIYLLGLLPLLSSQGGLFLGAFLMMAVVSLQPVLLILKGIWWPVVSVLLLMLIGQLAVFVYTSGQSILSKLEKQQHNTWFQLAHYQYEKGDYEVALTNL